MLFSLKKVAASTLTEVLIAMVIIMGVFIIAIGIYTRITTSQLSLSGHKSMLYMQHFIAEIIDDKDWVDSEVSEDGIRYKKIVSPYPGYSDLLLIRIEARQNGVKLGEIKEVVKIHEDE